MASIRVFSNGSVGEVSAFGGFTIDMVRKGGLEPPRYGYRQPLKRKIGELLCESYRHALR